jgi:kumamolisin
VCLLVQQLGRPLGMPHQTLYATAAPGVTAQGFRDITQGDNGAYQAAVGWDPCTGLGVPDGNALLGVFRGAATGAP